MRVSPRSFLRTLGAEWLDAVYPPLCRVCGENTVDGFTCQMHRLPTGPPGPRCGRCAVALPPALPHGYPCAACRGAPPRFGRVVALADYRASDAIRAWLFALKYGRRPDLAAPLGAVLGEVLAREASLADDALVVPVPLHALRRWERGYDQARRLAEAVSTRVRRDLSNALVRTRATPVQGALGAPARHVNVRGAFAVAPDRAPALIGRAVWLVDDVVTSCATIDECARTLRRSGARSVDVAVVARAG